MRTRRTNISGFTLLELVLVLMLVAIITAMIVPSIRVFGIGRGNDSAATLLVSLSRFARTQAVTEAKTYRLNLDPTNKQFWLSSDVGDGTFTDVETDLGRRVTVADDVNMRTDATPRQDGIYVEIQPTGRTEIGHVWFDDNDGGTTEVACMASTETFRVLKPSEMTR